MTTFARARRWLVPTKQGMVGLTLKSSGVVPGTFDAAGTGREERAAAKGRERKLAGVSN